MTLDTVTVRYVSNTRQIEGNLDLTGGWAHVFSTAIDAATLVAPPGTLSQGRTYTFALSATDTFGNTGYAGDESTREFPVHL